MEERFSGELTCGDRWHAFAKEGWFLFVFHETSFFPTEGKRKSPTPPISTPCPYTPTILSLPNAITSALSMRNGNVARGRGKGWWSWVVGASRLPWWTRWMIFGLLGQVNGRAK